ARQYILVRCRQANMGVSHFPQPPGIGKKISGASSTNAACCSSVSIRFPYPSACEASEANFLPASYTKSRQSCVGVLFQSLCAMSGSTFNLNHREWNSLFRQTRSEEHTSELQSRFDLVCRLLLE